MRRLTLLTLSMLAGTGTMALAQQGSQMPATPPATEQAAPAQTTPAAETAAPKPVTTQAIPAVPVIEPTKDSAAAKPDEPAKTPPDALNTVKEPAKEIPKAEAPANVQPTEIVKTTIIDETSIARIGHTTGGLDVDELTLISSPVLILKVAGKLDAVPETFNKGFEQLMGTLNGAGLKAVNAPMAVYTSIDDTSFKADLMVSVTQVPEKAPKGLSLGRSPAGRAIRVLHIGPMEKIEEAYADLETFVDDKGLNLRDIFLERYLTEPTSTPAHDMRTEIYVLTK